MVVSKDQYVFPRVTCGWLKFQRRDEPQQGLKLSAIIASSQSSFTFTFIFIYFS